MSIFNNGIFYWLPEGQAIKPTSGSRQYRSPTVCWRICAAGSTGDWSRTTSRGMAGRRRVLGQNRIQDRVVCWQSFLGKVTPHTLRHTAATWLDAGGRRQMGSCGFSRHERRDARPSLWSPSLRPLAHRQRARSDMVAGGNHWPKHWPDIEPAVRRRRNVLKLLVADAVVVEPVSTVKFPANREKNFSISGALPVSDGSLAQ